MKKLFIIILIIGIFVPVCFSLAMMAPGAPSVSSNTTSSSTSGVGGGTAVTGLQVNLQINGSHDPIVVPYNGNTPVSFQISWTSNDSNATCTLVNAFFPDGFNLAASGQQTSGALQPSEASSSGFNGYTITCTDNGQTATDTVPISFGSAPAEVPQANLTVNGQTGTVTVASGSQVEIQYTSSYLAHCMLDENGKLHANLIASDQWFTSFTTDQVYNLQCYNDYGTFFGNTVTIDEQPTQTTTPAQTTTSVVGNLCFGNGDCGAGYYCNRGLCAEGSAPVPTPTQTSTSTTAVTPVVTSTTTTTTPTTVTTCDSTAQAVITAAGGCSNINPTTYQNIYAVCCKITEATILQMLNTDLANGALTTTETNSLLSALNTYLSQ